MKTKHFATESNENLAGGCVSPVNSSKLFQIQEVSQKHSDSSQKIQAAKIEVTDQVNELLNSVCQNNLADLTDPKNQIQKKGDVTNFNIMVCGAAGIGKSSFVDLFMDKFKMP